MQEREGVKNVRKQQCMHAACPQGVILACYALPGLIVQRRLEPACFGRMRVDVVRSAEERERVWREGEERARTANSAMQTANHAAKT